MCDSFLQHKICTEQNETIPVSVTSKDHIRSKKISQKFTNIWFIRLWPTLLWVCLIFVKVRIFFRILVTSGKFVWTCTSSSSKVLRSRKMRNNHSNCVYLEKWYFKFWTKWFGIVLSKKTPLLEKNKKTFKVFNWEALSSTIWMVRVWMKRTTMNFGRRQKWRPTWRGWVPRKSSSCISYNLFLDLNFYTTFFKGGKVVSKNKKHYSHFSRDMNFR